MSLEQGLALERELQQLFARDAKEGSRLRAEARSEPARSRSLYLARGERLRGGSVYASRSRREATGVQPARAKSFA